MGPLSHATRRSEQAAAARTRPGELLARDAPAPAPARSTEPAAELPPDWHALRPSGWYANGGQRVLCLALVLAALPLALALALPVALANLIYFRDPRRIFFVQERVGRFGERFRIVKFRTMVETQRSVFDSWSCADVARVTPLGRFLRNAHLDELPQLWNVLRGDMSLFGPRPEMVEVDAWAREHVPEFHRRLAVMPGLTGLSQVTQGYAGRDVDAYRTKLEGDLVYIAQLGLRQDLGLLWRTAFWVVRGRGWRWSGVSS
jgi:lipopolysaccharide/colanic/teichoic acid biosynthesis glycosyltransferase